MLSFKRNKILQSKINSNSKKDINNDSLSYVLVDKKNIHIGDNVNFNLFFNQHTEMELFLQSNSVIDKAKQKKLNDIEELYVLESEKNKYNNFLEQRLQNVLQDQTLSIDEKTDIIYTASTELTQSLFSNPNALENAQRSKKIVAPILQSVIYNNDTIKSYIKIIEYDYYTHTHSLNVSIYALCLGAELGLDRKELTSLGRAALLHDLGKSKIQHDIVDKSGKLTYQEFEEMKSHPLLGHDIAIQIGIDDKNMLDGIRHHHEKLDGTGYPDKLKGNEITLFPRIIGACDIFDALTTRRSYKQALTSFNALSLMKSEMDTHLDTSIVNTFIKMLHK